MGFFDYLKVTGLFVIGLAILVLILYPIDQFFPWFDDIVPFLKNLSLFEFVKQNSFIILYFLLGGFFVYFIKEAI